MEVAAQAPALLLARRDEALACALQLGRLGGEGFDAAAPRATAVGPASMPCVSRFTRRWSIDRSGWTSSAASPVATSGEPEVGALVEEARSERRRVRHRP